MHCERDISTLKTLGQMLAKTGNTVESAVQTGLLGGCNAEDVKVVWDAFAVELAGMKQVPSLGTVLGSELPKGRHLGTSVVPKASENLMTLGLPNPCINLGPADGGKAGGVIGDKREATTQGSGSAAVANLPVPIGPPAEMSPAQGGVPACAGRSIDDNKTDEEEDEPNWDEVFENEEELVPSHVISAVNDEDLGHMSTEVRAQLEGVFDAFSYGFFGAPGEETYGGELLEDEDQEALEKRDGAEFSADSDGERKLVGWEQMGRDVLPNEPEKELPNVGAEHGNMEGTRTAVSDEPCCVEGENAVPTTCVGNVNTCSA